MSRLSEIWNIFFKLLCVLGCSYQVQNVLLSYFKYGTVTQSKFLNPVDIHFPSLHLCFLCLSDMINTSAVDRKYPNFPKRDPKYANFEMMEYLTVREMLDFTPNAIIDECKYRDRTGNEVHEKWAPKDCHQEFNVNKYLFQQYVCYHIAIKKSRLLPFHSVEGSLRFERIIYHVHFSGQIAKFRKLRLTLTDSGLPYLSRIYSPSFYKTYDASMSFHMNCHNFTIKSLGYPYDRYTCERRKKEFYDCINGCMEKLTYKRFNRLPYTLFHYELKDVKLVSPNMLRNETVSMTLNSMYDFCKASCPMFPCTYTYCLTVGHADTSTELGNTKQGSSIRVETPAHPDAMINYLPTVTILDIIVYVLSSLGTWFGLVIISCNPIHLLIKPIKIVLRKRFWKRNTKAGKQSKLFIHRTNIRWKSKPQQVHFRQRIHSM